MRNYGTAGSYFDKGNNGMKFTVHGNYDGEYDDQVFIKVQAEYQML